MPAATSWAWPPHTPGAWSIWPGKTRRPRLSGAFTPSASTLTGTLSIGSLASGGGLEAVMMPPAGINTIVNAVACTGAPAIDQRGVTRPQQGLQCDIGAVERKAIEDMIFLDGFEGN